MRTFTSRTLRALAVAASTTAIVALAGPAQAIGDPAVYADGFGPNSNKACRGGHVDIIGDNLPADGHANVIEFNIIVRKTVDTNLRGHFVAKIGSIGEKGKVPYHVDVYDELGHFSFTKTVTVNWVKCAN